MLYELLGGKFCSSFFQLGCALLESCAASAKQGRQQCADAAVDLAMLMAEALKRLKDPEPLGKIRSTKAADVADTT